MAILVTGVAGFIGFHTALSLLSRGEEVIGIDNLNDYYPVSLKQARIAEIQHQFSTGFEFHMLDFADMSALTATLAGKSIDRIVHLGAQAGVRYSLTNPHAYAQSNLVGHLNMLELARHMDRCEHMVYASSSSVYGANDKIPFSVDDRVEHPVSLYAATKKADELMSETYAHLYRMPLTGLRFFTVYGPWGRPDMAAWLFTDAIYNDRPINIFNNGDMRRDFTYIDDIVSGIIATLDAPPLDNGQIKAGGSRSPHHIYNIGNHRSEKLLDMIDVLEQAIGKKAVRNYLPMQPGDVKETYADIKAIQADVGYEPSTTIEIGLPRFVEWFKNYHQIV